MKITNWIRFIITLGSGLAIALALTFSLGIGVALGDDQPDGSTINPTQTTSGTWGPGVITATSNVVISPTAVITIAPGTTIRVAGNYGFTVNGELRSDGPITFTSIPATPGAWAGITYTTNSRGYLNQAIVEYAQHAVVLNAINPITISNSTLRYNRHAPASGQDAYGAGLVIVTGNHLIDHTDIYSNSVRASGSGAEAYGGGIDIQAGATRILYSRIYSNSATSTASNGGGGGIVIRAGSAPLIQNSEVTSNTLVTQANLANGGGIGFYGTTQAVIRNSWIAANRAVPTGGNGGGGGIGFEADARAMLIDSNVIAYNLSWGPGHSEGGGIDSWDRNVFTASNNLIFGNRTRTYGGGININGVPASGDVNVINNTVVSNTVASANNGGGIYRQNGGRVYNNIAFRNTANNVANDIAGSAGSAGNNLTTDPLFIGTGDLVQWYRIRQGSPAIDAATNTGAGIPNNDYDQQSRPLGTSRDIGFDEVQPFTYTKSVNQDKGSGGYPLVYTIAITNPDPRATLVSGRISDVIPLSTTYSAGPACSTGTCSYDSGTRAITWVGDVPTNGGVLTLSYTVLVNAGLANGTRITNTALITVGAKSGWTNVVTTTIYNAPRADNDSFSTNEDATLTVPNATRVLVNDTGYNGNPLTAIRVSNPTSGTLTLNSDGTFTYTPAPDYYGPDSFTYRANDGVADSNVATVSITIIPINDAPSFTQGADQTVNEDAGPQTVSGWATNISAGPNESGQTLTFNVTDNTNPALFAAGPAVDATTGNLTFTPAPNTFGSATIAITLQDNGGTANGGVDTSAPQSFAITVNPVNDAPSFIQGADQTVNEDAGPQTVTSWATGISAGPANESGQVLTFNVTGNTNPALFAAGPAVHATTGDLTYTPAPNAFGSATITITLQDDGGTANGGVDTSAPQSFAITVNPINDQPVAKEDTYGVDEDATLTVPAPGVLTNDTDADGDLLTAVWVSGPSHGTLVLSANGSFTYTPVLDYNGPDGFTYKAKDSLVESNVATVTITVHTGNDAPVAVNDSYTTTTNVPLVKDALGVLSNDTDTEHDALTAARVSDPSHGALTLNSNGSFVYTPTANYAGFDSFTYTANDGQLNSNVATVTITINNPVPAITSLYPVSVTAGSPPFTLVVTGANFVNGSTIYWNGSALTTTLVNDTQLQAAISADAVTTAGPVSITVVNPAPGGGASNVSLFTISSPAPAPAFRKIYLPLVMRESNSVRAPDLVIVSVTVTPNNARVVIKNQGSTLIPVGNTFWVDLYVNPSPVPTGVNQIWNDGRSAQGMVWGIAGSALPLEPGETLTLTNGDIYYWSSFSNYGSVPGGTPVYVQVDSSKAGSSYGAVLESHEIGGGTYNNIVGPVYVTSGAAGLAETTPPVTKDRSPASLADLPPRR